MPMKKLTVAVVISALFIVVGIAAAGCSAKKYGVADSGVPSGPQQSASLAPPPISGAESAVSGSISSSVPNTQANAAIASDALTRIDSNAQDIEEMLNGIAKDNASLPSANSTAAQIDSLANQLDSYLSPDTDNISNINK